MRPFYTLAMLFYGFVIRLIAFKNPKATLWIEGRKQWKQNLRKAFQENKKPVVWVHCSSLGEFEQGRPVIEELRAKKQDVFILLTFFSPSGYEIRKNYQQADYVCYLPLDTLANARDFVSIAKPSVALFIKYEFWYNYLKVLKNNHIPVWLISGIFRPQQHFFKFWGGWFRKQLNCFDYFFLQNQTSARLLNNIGFTNYTVGGDTRFDRVVQVASQAKVIESAEKFTDGKFTIVAGSTWPADEDILAQFINESDESLKFIIAPHEIDKEHIQKIAEKITKKTVFYSNILPQTNLSKAQVLLIDNIGMLSSLYRYGNVVLVGGGFGKGIHNILEPAVFGVPVIIGPKYSKFREAVDLVERGTVFPIQTYEDFKKLVYDFIQNPQKLQHISSLQGQYIQSMSGSTAIIVQKLSDQLKMSM
jgi:3-deoxy-D-manno-octulosonic-acid transferase